MLRLSIRRKLAIALAVPLTALVMLTVLEMLQTARAAARVSAQTELARAAIGPSGIITALQNERAWLGALLVGQQDAVSVPVRGTDETRAQTNAAIDAFRDEIARRDTVVREAFRPGLQDLDELDEIRAHFDTESGPRALSNIGTVDDAFARYTALIEPFFQGTTRVGGRTQRVTSAAYPPSGADSGPNALPSAGTSSTAMVHTWSGSTRW